MNIPEKPTIVGNSVATSCSIAFRVRAARSTSIEALCNRNSDGKIIRTSVEDVEISTDGCRATVSATGLDPGEEYDFKVRSRSTHFPIPSGWAPFPFATAP